MVVTKSTAEQVAEQIYTATNTQATITSVRADKKKATVQFKATGGGNTGYQIAYRLKGKKWKTKNTSNTILTIKKLKRKKTYSVRVRSYKKVKGKVYYGKWSKIMKIKTL